MANPSPPLVSLREHVRQVLSEAYQQSGLDVEQLAEHARVHPETVRRLLRGERCGLDSVDRVSRVLRVDWRSRP